MFDGGEERSKGNGGFPSGSGPGIGPRERAELIAWALFAAAMALAILVTIGSGIVGRWIVW